MKKYVINLNRRDDKLLKFRNTCPFKDVIRLAAFNALNPKNNSIQSQRIYNYLLRNIKNRRPGEYGCFTSHIMIWERMIKEGDKYVMVFEDDAIFCKDFVHKMDGLMKHINLVDTILYIGGRYTPNYIPTQSTMVREGLVKYNMQKEWTHGDVRERTTHAYIIHRSCCQFLLNSLRERPLQLPVDHYMIYALKERNMDIYNSTPLLCHSPRVDPTSDIQARCLCAQCRQQRVSQPHNHITRQHAEKLRTLELAVAASFGTSECSIRAIGPHKFIVTGNAVHRAKSLQEAKDRARCPNFARSWQCTQDEITAAVNAVAAGEKITVQKR